MENWWENKKQSEMPRHVRFGKYTYKVSAWALKESAVYISDDQSPHTLYRSLEGSEPIYLPNRDATDNQT